MLNRELIKHILKNLGVVPGKSFGLAGITNNEFLKNNTVTIDDLLFEVRSAKATFQSVEFRTLLLSPKKQVPDPEFTLVLQIDSSIMGIRFLWDGNDPGIILIQTDEKWLQLDMFNRLNLTASIELLTTEGVLWYPDAESEELYKQSLMTLIESEE